MLLRFVILLIATLMYFYQQEAQAQSSKSNSRASNKRVYRAPAQDKKTRHHIERIGLVATVNYFGSGLGLNYGYTPNNFFQIDYQLVQTTAKLSGGTAFNAEEVFDVQMIRLSALPKIQILSQFYIGAGFNISSLSGSYGFRGSDIQNNEVSSELKATVLHGDLFLGSQWQGERFYLAADWLGVSYLSKLHSQSLEENPNLDSTTRLLTGESSAERIDREIAQQLRLYYLSIHAGLRF